MKLLLDYFNAVVICSSEKHENLMSVASTRKVTAMQYTLDLAHQRHKKSKSVASNNC